MAKLKEILAEQSDIQQAAARDMPEAQEQGKSLREMAAEILPTRQEIGAELGNRVEEGKSFLGNMLSEIGAEVVNQVKHGSHELSAALLRGSDGFVMYQREDSEPTHGLPPEAQKQPEQQKEQGMEMEM